MSSASFPADSQNHNSAEAYRVACPETPFETTGHRCQEWVHARLSRAPAGKVDGAPVHALGDLWLPSPSAEENHSEAPAPARMASRLQPLEYQRYTLKGFRSIPDEVAENPSIMRSQ